MTFRGPGLDPDRYLPALFAGAAPSEITAGVFTRQQVDEVEGGEELEADRCTAEL